MNTYKYDIVFQEVPNHISLAFSICGCSLHCPGCHSPELWPESAGFPLTEELYMTLLAKYKNRVDCVLFLGGEWHQSELIKFLKMARSQHFKTALYTGQEDVSEELKKNLSFLKTGSWKSKLGGLSSSTTNQVFRDLETNSILNHLFQL